MHDAILTECVDVLTDKGIMLTGIVKDHLDNGRLRVRVLDVAETVRECEVEEVSEGVYQQVQDQQDGT